MSRYVMFPRPYDRLLMGKQKKRLIYNRSVEILTENRLGGFTEVVGNGQVSIIML